MKRTENRWIVGLVGYEMVMKQFIMGGLNCYSGLNQTTRELKFYGLKPRNALRTLLYFLIKTKL